MSDETGPDTSAPDTKVPDIDPAEATTEGDVSDGSEQKQAPIPETGPREVS